jgi:protein ImuB
MGRREAEALSPVALVLEHDPAEEARRFEPVVAAVEALVPRVEVADPGLLYLPVAGAVRFYGGEEELVGKVAAELELVAPGGLLGLADGPFAARWAAAAEPVIVVDTPAFLASLEVAALPKTELVETLRWLGIASLGELAALPREAMASRFGRVGLEAHRLASGEDRGLTPRLLPGEWAVESRFEDPLLTIDQAGFAARALAARLLNRLSAEGVAPYRVLVEAESEDGEARSRVWRSADPFTEHALGERVWWQLRAWIEQGGVEGGLVRLRLDPADVSGGGRQLSLLEDTAAAAEAERALARTQALLGPDAVLQARPQGGRLPGERVRWHRWGDDPPPLERDPAQPWAGAVPEPAPALVPPRPPPIEIEWDGGMPARVRLGARWEPVLNWAGPWRLLGRWWQGEGPVDRYQIVTSAGAVLVMVDEAGRATLSGIYD